MSTIDDIRRLKVKCFNVKKNYVCALVGVLIKCLLFRVSTDILSLNSNQVMFHALM